MNSTNPLFNGGRMHLDGTQPRSRLDIIKAWRGNEKQHDYHLRGPLAVRDDLDWLLKRVERLEKVLAEVTHSAIPQWRPVIGQPELTTFDGLVPEGVMCDVYAALEELEEPAEREGGE